MKDQKELYEALESLHDTIKIRDASHSMADIHAHVVTIKEVASEGMLNELFANTAVAVIEQYATLLEDMVEDFEFTLMKLQQGIVDGLSEPEAKYVEEEEY